MVLGLEAMLFILLGLQAPQVADELEVAPLVWQAVVVGLTVVAVRMAFAIVPQAGFGDTWRERVAVGWAGMRGAISLAAALSIPLDVEARPEILLLTFGVILVTLLGQGLTLAPLLRKLDLRGDERWSPDEATARLETAQAALDRLEELEEEGASRRAGAPPARALPRPLRALRRRARRRRAARGRPPGAEGVRRDAARADPGRARRADRPAQRPEGSASTWCAGSSATSTSTRRGSVRSRLRRR